MVNKTLANQYSVHNKPEITLTQLEEEPLSGFFGCTYTEVKAAMRSAIMTVFVSTILLTFVVNWALAAALAMLPGVWWFFNRIKRASSLRADRPSFFHRHASTYKKGHLFIQPQKQYQIWRNAHEGKKKR
ncbi:MAG: hypothetical protein Q4A74_04730 [Cardiobacteriaceae bacterium]|nr:hypothetical protein [Cardiobacteriaceae bacterium]